MIFDAIFSAVFGVLSALIAVLPSAPFQAISAAVAGVSWMTDFVVVANFIFPVKEALAIVLAVFALRVSGLVVAALMRIWAMLPFLGHAAV